MRVLVPVKKAGVAVSGIVCDMSANSVKALKHAGISKIVILKLQKQ
jgi:hypothetical protein